MKKTICPWRIVNAHACVARTISSRTRRVVGTASGASARTTAHNAARPSASHSIAAVKNGSSVSGSSATSTDGVFVLGPTPIVASS